MAERNDGGNQSTESVLVIRRFFDAKPEQVFDAWFDPATLGRWLFSTPDGEMVKIQIDAREGGSFLIAERRGKEIAQHFGTYIQIDRPNKLVFGFAMDKAATPTRVTVDFKAVKNGCQVTLTHELDPQWIAYGKSVQQGWTMILAGLWRSLVQERSLSITRVFDAPRELVFDMWTDPKHIAQWWGPRGFTITTYGMEVKPGGVWRLCMHGPDGTDYQNKITYVEVVRPERLVYKHGGDKECEPPSFEVTVTFDELSHGQYAGKTIMTMHMLFPTAVARKFVVDNYGADKGLTETISRLEEQVAAKIQKPFAITRDFDAPRDLVWKVWTEREHIMKWGGPKGSEMTTANLDFRPGGIFHYALRSPDGKEMWGKALFREITAPHRIVQIQSFSDEKGNITAHPLSATWPAQMLTTITFTEHQGKTRVAIEWVPFHASQAEQDTFNSARDGMKMGWTGTLDQLAEYLATV